ncbi:hypothetical protein Tco_0743791 [Tanacetum coccineum]
MKRKEDNKNVEQPNKRVCKSERFEAIKYSLGPNEEYIVKKGNIILGERNEDRPRCKEIEKVGEVSINLESYCVIRSHAGIEAILQHSSLLITQLGEFFRANIREEFLFLFY